MSDSRQHKDSGLALAVTALGVVFGDIGTSPLYAMRECFSGPHAIAMNATSLYGVLSLIFWALMIVISVKYISFIMRTDNRGEGGILALVALTCVPERIKNSKYRFAMLAVGLFGATLLYGDGIITPAISVLSALEGLKVATKVFEPFIIPLTVAVLVGIFAVQKHGTARIGAIFGPITLVWFFTLGVLGLVELVKDPAILAAINPLYAVAFFRESGYHGFLVLGTVFLAITGGEALYADMGHFGRGPIKNAWYAVVLPCLILNYFGQGALLLRNPNAIENPFFQLAPTWLVYPLVLLATMATVIASQALISGVYSLTRQAILLGYQPRMQIVHTSSKEIGQIYIPAVNWALLIGAVSLVLQFRSSSSMAAAYGVAVSLTMLITTLLAAIVARKIWKWGLFTTITVFSLFLFIDAAFFLANATKILHGGWIPLVIAVGIQFLMMTWIRGRQLLFAELKQRALPIKIFMEEVSAKAITRVPGTAVFMTGSTEGAPLALLNNTKHNKVLHERVLFLTFQPTELPHVPKEEAVSVEDMGHGFWRVVAKLGFMDDLPVREVLRLARQLQLDVNEEEVTFFLGREVILASPKKGMALWREKLFAFMSRNAQNPTAFFDIPVDRVIEVGTQIEL
jgi:KUP system potassium uptake protein